MKTVYEPSNALEAHMLHDLLQHEGIPSRVDGAYLQGAVGELPASGLVRLVVEDDDYERARAVIRRWEATEVSEPTPPPAQPLAGGFGGVLAGVLIGVVGAFLFFRAPMNNDGVDYNHDGVLDQVWRYSPSGTFLGTRVDRNLDGRTDYLEVADRRGYVVSAEADDDFDGNFETGYRFHAGNYESGEVDTDGDTIVDLKMTYQHGVLASVEYLNPHTALPVRVEHYRLSVLTAAEVDVDKDGRLDTRYTYSPAAEITGKQAISAR
ncbi:hypothetical protein Tbd_1068 [Thiobacillus denitrificans ATCC 25259]|uniref:DUF2007 domain-containing protein n=1 Tax=Thiobacillus denitrificans (strain ATCC 25259 / T1) TaxID=292415 RepID=Q3SJX8_THIDA|nr:DUF2007 domain-containing protein [Thiobacillus denitrificans]AAZ97021.1 hypothetical protein Tbd_1068 [Thiobacillus denitrificans ATCC 25259]